MTFLVYYRVLVTTMENLNKQHGAHNVTVGIGTDEIIKKILALNTLSLTCLSYTCILRHYLFT